MTDGKKWISSKAALICAVVLLLLGVFAALLGVKENVQDRKIYDDVLGVLQKYDEACPIPAEAAAELDQVFSQKWQNPVRIAIIHFVDVSKSPDYPSIKRDGDEQPAYEYRDTKPYFGTFAFSFSGDLRETIRYNSYEHTTQLKNMWMVTFSSNCDLLEYSAAAFGGAAILLIVSGVFWRIWYKRRKTASQRRS